MSVDVADSNPMLVASFHKFRLDSLQALPFCSQLQRVSPHRPEAEKKKWKARNEYCIMHIHVGTLICLYLLFVDMERDRMNKFPIAGFRNSTYPIYWKNAEIECEIEKWHFSNCYCDQWLNKTYAAFECFWCCPFYWQFANIQIVAFFSGQPEIGHFCHTILRY